jgi:hypothetical protein
LHSIEEVEWRFNGQENTESFSGLRVIVLSNVQSVMSTLETGGMLPWDILKIKMQIAEYFLLKLSLIFGYKLGMGKGSWVYADSVLCED